MALSLVTAPALEPVSLAEAKRQCYVDHTNDDALLRGLIGASRHTGESFTHRPWITQTWDYKLDGFCGGDYLELPLPPVSAVTYVKYYDMSATLQTWSSATDYEVDLPAGPKAAPARIAPRLGVPWPPTYPMLNAVVVRFVCGYGANASSVPDALLQGMKVLIAHWYEQRTPVNIGNLVTPIPYTVDALWWPYKAFGA